MSPTGRSRVVHSLLVLSLAANAATFAYLARSGGLRRVFLKLDLAELPATRRGFQEEMEARYRKYPNTEDEVVFAGDSLIADGPWAEFFSEVRNRGIGGETAKGLAGRIDEVLESRPRQLFLLVGTNDLAAAVPPAQYLRHYRGLLERIRRESPGTAVVAIGILPVNPTFPKRPTQDNARIAEANRGLAKLVAEFPGVRFLDVGDRMADDAKALRREYTTDGVHLSTEGYLALREALRAYVEGAPADRPGGTPPPRASPVPGA